MRRDLLRVPLDDPALRRRRRRPAPAPLFVVQPRLPGPAPHRLAHAGRHSGKDHSLRGGARDQGLGRSAPPARSQGPALLRLLPSLARRRAAGLRGGGAGARHARQPSARCCTSPRRPSPAERPTTAVFYSISNCQEGLRGISFGNFLLKQVVEELEREVPSLKTFVTLSPMPRFARWLAETAARQRRRRRRGGRDAGRR